MADGFPEKYQISREELDMVLEDSLKDLVPWGANIKFQPNAHEGTESPPGFAPGVKQDPTPSDAAHKLNMSEGQLVQQLASWLDSGRTHSPQMPGPLGIILRLVPRNKGTLRNRLLYMYNGSDNDSSGG